MLIAKITSKKLEEKTCTINYFSKYSLDTEVHNNCFKFDVKNPKPLSFWIFKEYTQFHSDTCNKAYFQHIMQFLVNDNIELNIPLINENGVLQLSTVNQEYLNKGKMIVPTFKWKTLIISKCPQTNILELDSLGLIGTRNQFNKEPVVVQTNNIGDFYNKNEKINKVVTKDLLDFDLSRFCELEVIKNVWVNLKSSHPGNNTIKFLENVFSPYFVIKDIFADDIGYIIYKIVMIAAQEGRLDSKIKGKETELSNLSNTNNLNQYNSINDYKLINYENNSAYNTNNDFINISRDNLSSLNYDFSKMKEKTSQVIDEIGITIKILGFNSPLTNEVKKNCLIYDRKNSVQCRVGDVVVFYITKN